MGRVQKVQKIAVTGGLQWPRLLFALSCLGFVLSGCSTLPKPDVDKETINLIQSQTEIPESELLDVRIEVFDPGELPDSEAQARGLSTEIRKAEARYIPVHLKKAIEQTGRWGAVRVIPSGNSGDEVLLIGQIINSNGEILEISIDVYDAVGNHWFGDTYKGAVDVKMYEKAEKSRTEAFQNVYNRIANDLTNYRLQMTSVQVRQIRQVAELRFAEEMAPTIFSGYLRKDDDKQSDNNSAGSSETFKTEDIKNFFSGLLGNGGRGAKSDNVPKGVYIIDRLPAEDDDSMQRIRRIRERDYLLVDALDGHYEGLYRKMQDTYMQWRVQRVKEIDMIRAVEEKQQKEVAKGVAAIFVAVLVGAAGSSNNSGSYNPGVAGAAGALAGAGVAKIMDASDIDEEADINRAALEELGDSFSADVDPIVIEVEGQTVRLTGTVQAKYQQWREVIAKLYVAETGIMPEPN